MLTKLEIQNVALIDRLETELSGGMTVLTGETGAGKSIIIDSVNLILGARASKGIIRYGTDKARVQAIFDVSDSVREKLIDMGIEVDDSTIAILRDVTADGKSVCRINGMVVAQSVLRDVAACLVNIHGQQDNISLLNPKYHLDYLDSFAENTKELSNYKEKYAKYKEIKERLLKLSTNEQERLERADLLRYQTDEIAAAELTDGEKDELLEERALIQNAEALTGAVAEATEILYDGDGANAYDFISQAARAMERLDEVSSAQAAAEKLYDIKYALEDAVREVRNLADGVEYSPARLAEIEDRLDLIGKLERKYGGSIEAINEYYEKAMEELKEIDGGTELTDKLEKDCIEAEKQMITAAEELRKTRVLAGEKLSRDIESSLSELDMPKVRFAVDISPKECGTSGADIAEFMICPNVGEELKPLAKFASGGELSRVMLAMKSILADADDTDTLIFDEIDTGVSGSAAQKIAKKLKKLGEKKQVICVSHQPQLAAAAGEHLLIEKTESESRTVTNLYRLDFDARVREIARIIDGNKPSEEALTLSRAMIENA